MNPITTASTIDAGTIPVGAGYKLLPVMPASVKDAGKIKLGAGYDLLPRG